MQMYQQGGMNVLKTLKITYWSETKPILELSNIAFPKLESLICRGNGAERMLFEILTTLQLNPTNYVGCPELTSIKFERTLADVSLSDVVLNKMQLGLNIIFNNSSLQLLQKISRMFELFPKLETVDFSDRNFDRESHASKLKRNPPRRLSKKSKKPLCRLIKQSAHQGQEVEKQPSPIPIPILVHYWSKMTNKRKIVSKHSD